MQLYAVIHGEETTLAEHRPFESEDELEEFVYENQGLLGDLKAFARQATSADRKHIPDILAVDDDGKLFVGEIKNVHTDQSIVNQVLRYYHWAKKRPLEVKQLWDQSKDKEGLTEPIWSDLDVGVLVIAPSFDLESLKGIVDFAKAQIRFLKVQRYRLGSQYLITTDYLEETEDLVLESAGFPKARGKYAIEHYKDLTEEYYPEFLSLVDEVDRIRDELGLGWLRRRFNKEYVSYKNGHFNVFEVYIWSDGSPGMGFHLPTPPWELNIEIPKTAIDREGWDKKYRIYYVPSVRKGIEIRNLIPLFEQAKLYRGQR